MPLPAERFATAALLLAGALMLALLVSSGAEASDPALLLHWQFLVALLGLGLIAAAFVPSIRLPAVICATLHQVALLVLSQTVPASGSGFGFGWANAVATILVVCAGLIFWKSTVQQARWEGVRP